jgi:hypothetical protein
MMQNPARARASRSVVKNVKIAILVCGVIGLAALIVPFGGRSLLKEYFDIDPLGAGVYAAIFALPIAMAILALARPPMQSWQPGVALAGFVLGVVRFHVWELVAHLGTAGVQGALIAATLVIGTIAAVAALIKPEAPM